jgi:hypothetical protein
MKLFERILLGLDRFNATEADFRLFATPGGALQSIDGGVTASVAGVMPAPTGLITVVSGALAITGITVPYPTFSGMIVYIPTGAFTWTVATNIALAGTAVVGKALQFFYLPSTAKWYPSYIA